jgi:hypothetical protein
MRQAMLYAFDRAGIAGQVLAGQAGVLSGSAPRGTPRREEAVTA